MQLARRSSHFLDFSGCVSPRRNYKNSWPNCMPRSIFFAIFCFNFCDFFTFFLPRILPRISPSPATAFEPVPFLALPGQAMPSHAEAKPEPSQARPERERERETLDFIFDRETRTMKTLFFTHETGFQQTLLTVILRSFPLRSLLELSNLAFKRGRSGEGGREGRATFFTLLL